MTATSSTAHRPVSEKTAPAHNAHTGPRLDIQGLRALAVIAVVLDHTIHWPNGGFVGVDVFFVISGFLITGLLLREAQKTNTISFPTFYRRRIRRILPAAMLTIVATIVGSYLVFNSGRFQSTVVDAVWGTFFAANWRFASQGTDYFAAAGPVSPLQHYWSLSVEEQFYFVWPVLLMAAILSTRTRRGRVDAPRMTRVATVMILVVSGASLVWAVFETATNPSTAYFSTFSRAWELGAGALLALLAPRLSRIPVALRPLLSWIGLLGILASYAFISEGSGFPAPLAAAPVLATALVIAAGVGSPSRFVWPLTNPVSRYVGDISYSLYLWHFPALMVAGPFVAHLTGVDDGPVYAGIVIGLAFAFAALSFHLVETPIRTSSWLEPTKATPGRSTLAPRHVAVIAAAIATVVVVSSSLLVDAVPRGAQAANAAGGGTTTGEGEEGSGLAQTALTEQIEAALAADEWPSDIAPTLDVVDAEELPGNTGRCGGAVLLEASECTFGAPDAPKTALLVGDSIAHMYVPALVTMFGSGEWKIRVVSMYACPFLSIDVGDLLPRVELCKTRKQQEMEIVDETRPDLLIVANTYWRSTDIATGTMATIADWDGGFRDIMGQVADATDHILVIPPPAPDKDIEECWTGFSSPSDCVSDIGSTDWSDMANVQRTATEELGGTWIDNRLWFCSEANQCPAFVGSTLMKKDQAHITAVYAAMIAPAMREALEEAEILTGEGESEADVESPTEGDQTTEDTDQAGGG